MAHIVRLDKAQGFSKIRPTKTFSKKLSLELAGLELEVLHAPGETDDQIVVWYPAKRVLFPADQSTVRLLNSLSQCFLTDDGNVGVSDLQLSQPPQSPDGGGQG